MAAKKISTALFLIFLLLECQPDKVNKQVSNDSIKKDQVDSKIEVSDTTKHKVDPWKIKICRDNLIVFNNGDSIKTTLFEPEIIDRIDLADKPPYLLIEAFDCQNCDANSRLYIHSPINGDLIAQNGENSYSLASEVYDFNGDTLIYESRVFYGNVLPDTVGILWIQKSLNDDNFYKKSAFLFHITDSIVNQGFLDIDLDNLTDRTLSQKRKGLCKELKKRKWNAGP